VVNFNLTPYEETIGTLQSDLLVLKEVAERTTSLGELRHMESALVTLENKLVSIRRFAPRTRRKHSLLNAGGLLLKSLFGTATSIDVDKPHATVNELHHKQGDITHSIDKQVTYFRHLDDTVTFDHQGILNLSSVIQNFARSTRNTFQEVSSKFDLASKLREAAAEIRKLEFALFCLETYTDEYMVAIQTVITGKIPVNIIKPSILQNILKNISLNLPEGYELIMGSNPYDTEWYYEFVHAAMVTNPQGFMLILSIPIKHVYRQFELFRLYNFPTEVLNRTSVNFFFWKMVGSA
jgi:hypothetical protein